MKIRYFAGTDTLLIEFREAPVTETRDLDENTLLDLDANGNISSAPKRSIFIKPDASLNPKPNTPRRAPSTFA